MGRSASPFKRFVHKCDRMQSLQCLRWQVVQSAGDVSDSAFIHTAPLCSLFCVCCSFTNSLQVQKRKNAKRLFLFASFLSTKCCAVGQHVGDFIVEKTKQNYNFWWRLATPPSFSLSFSDPPLYPSPNSFFPFLHCCRFSLSILIFDAMMFPVGRTENRRKIAEFFYNLQFYFESITPVCFLDAAAKLFCAWLRKKHL